MENSMQVVKEIKDRSIIWYRYCRVAKNPAANARDMDLIPGSEGSPEVGNGNPLQYSCQDNPIDRDPVYGQATVHGVTKSQTQLSIHADTETHCTAGCLSKDNATPIWKDPCILMFIELLSVVKIRRQYKCLLIGKRIKIYHIYK